VSGVSLRGETCRCVNPPVLCDRATAGAEMHHGAEASGAAAGRITQLTEGLAALTGLAFDKEAWGSRRGIRTAQHAARLPGGRGQLERLITTLYTAKPRSRPW